MRKIRKRRSYRDIFFSALIGISVLGVVAFLVITNLRISQRRTELKTKIEELKTEIQLLEEKNAKLRAGISDTQKESHWEEQVREQGFVREGESQVVVVPPAEKGNAGVGREKSFWEKIFEKLGF